MNRCRFREDELQRIRETESLTDDDVPDSVSIGEHDLMPFALTTLQAHELVREVGYLQACKRESERLRKFRRHRQSTQEQLLLPL